MCKCGCDTCETKSTALVLNESKAPKTILSEGLKHHIDTNKPLTEHLYRAGSRAYFDLFAEARSLYSRGILEFTHEDDIALLTETNLGHFGMFEGKKVPLDFPIELNEHMDIEDEVANMEFGMDYEQLGSGEKEWVRDEIDNMSIDRDNESVGSMKRLKGWNLNEDIYDKFLDNPSSPKGRAKSLILKFTKEYGDDASSMAVDRFASKNNLKPEEKYILKYITKNDIKISSQSGGPDFSTLNESDSKYPSFEVDKNIRYQDTVVTKGYWTYSGKESGGRGVYQNVMNNQMLGFNMDDLNYFKKHLPDHFNISENRIYELVNEAVKKKKGKNANKPIGKPMRDTAGGKAYKVYVKDPKTKKVKTVRFGSGGLRAKINDSKARAAFAARHKCSSKKDRTKAGYWSCRLPRYAKLLGLKSSFSGFW